MNTDTSRTSSSILPVRVISLGACALATLTLLCVCLTPASALASRPSATPVFAAADPLEAAASKAQQTGRTVAMSLIGLAFAIAAIVLAFRRDFKDAAGILAIGILAVFLASSHGTTVLEQTVNKLFG